jgi:hypothetical protein
VLSSEGLESLLYFVGDGCFVMLCSLMMYGTTTCASHCDVFCGCAVAFVAPVKCMLCAVGTAARASILIAADVLSVSYVSQHCSVHAVLCYVIYTCIDNIYKRRLCMQGI